MSKILAAIIAAAFAAVSFGAIAAKHEEGMKKDAPKAEAKKDAKAAPKAEAKKEEKKADKK
jgi:Ni/Co efflux regulator RcnB